ncbi:hypothetical protein BYT27DRAFT_6561562 [Phlegmacium glaucopus]|nr:hypothetical protein BYT27DRAFT_6561562 [Phlegmacium glaucopus]
MYHPKNLAQNILRKNTEPKIEILYRTYAQSQGPFAQITTLICAVNDHGQVCIWKSCQTVSGVLGTAWQKEFGICDH